MVNRSNELKQLETEYSRDNSNIVLLYGRTGCGKEELISSFIEDKKCFYYRARQCSNERQFSYLKDQIESTSAVRVMGNTYDDCLSRLAYPGNSKLVVVIDEVQNAIKKDNDLYASILKLKSGKLFDKPVMIILASSSIVWAEKTLEELVGAQLHFVDSKMKLTDVSFLDVVRAFPEYSVAQCVSTYGIIGGVSAYLDRWNGKKSIRENIIENILSPEGFLFTEAEDFISTELRELSVYSTILSSIAAGNEKLNDLFEDTGYSRAKISVYIKNLSAFDVVDKADSFETGGWENTKKGVYQITSPYINFWYTFVYPHLSELYMLSAGEFYDRFIEKELNSYLSRYFADVCREYLHLLNVVGKLPIKITKIGTWIGKEGTIDVVGQDPTRENVVGICNWSEEQMPYKTYEDLLDNMKKARISAVTKYLFSATAFDPKLEALAKQDSTVVLVNMTEL